MSSSGATIITATPPPNAQPVVLVPSAEATATATPAPVAPGGHSLFGFSAGQSAGQLVWVLYFAFAVTVALANSYLYGYMHGRQRKPDKKLMAGLGISILSAMVLLAVLVWLVYL
jgi:hypothetical protein